MPGQDARRPVAEVHKPATEAPLPVAPPPLPAQRPDPRARTMERVRALAELNSMISSRISVPLTVFSKLNDDFARLFNLSEVQTRQLQDAIMSARASLAVLSARNARVESLPDGSFNITIPPFAAEGGAVYDQLTQSVRTILGDEAFSYYQALGADPSGSTDFSKFGLAERNLHVGRVRDEHGNPTLSSGTMTDKDGFMTETMTSDISLFATQHPQLYQQLVAQKLLPPAP